MITIAQQKILDYVAAHTELEWILHTDDNPNGDRQAIVLKDSISTCPYLAASSILLTGNEAVEFFEAADNKPGHDRELRLAILKACRLVIEAQPCH